jgi:hypothetical protein
MNWVCCIIGITSILIVDGFPSTWSRASSRRTQMSPYEEKKKKCFYVNEMFPVSETTCSIRPNEYYYYKNEFYLDELWKYQQIECLPQKPDFSIVLFYLIMICLWIGFAVNC